MQKSVTGIAWYRAEDYDRLKAMFVDGWKLPDTYEDWSKIAQDAYDTLTEGGTPVLKAFIDPDTFPEWCRIRGFKMDTQARLAFGTDYAQENYPPKSK